ncbi:MAG TPA: hypothetical protein DCL55_03575, partial [Brevundimonas sp.]|nr:hypothetical protein [Brevundimonas sp.]
MGRFRTQSAPDGGPLFLLFPNMQGLNDRLYPAGPFAHDAAGRNRYRLYDRHPHPGPGHSGRPRRA